MTRRMRTSATTSSRAPRLTRHPTRQRSTRCAPSSRSSSARVELRLSDPVAQPLEQPRERSVLLHLYAQMAHARVVERLAASVVDLELARAENLESLLERLRSTLLTRAYLRGAPRITSR